MLQDQWVWVRMDDVDQAAQFINVTTDGDNVQVKLVNGQVWLFAR
jgi:hypothetical protein